MSYYIDRELKLIAMEKALRQCATLNIARIRLIAYVMAGINIDDVERYDSEAMRRAEFHRDLIAIKPRVAA